MNKKIFSVLLAVAIAGSFIFSTSAEAAEWCHTFNVNMRKGDRSEEVSALQAALIKEGFLDIAKPTGYYGMLTFNAVAAFQEKYASETLAPFGLAKGTGKAATYTRIKLNQFYGCGTGSSGNAGGSTKKISCSPNWQCGEWSGCANSEQTRICHDSNNCGVAPASSLVSQMCVSNIDADLVQ